MRYNVFISISFVEIFHKKKIEHFLLIYYSSFNDMTNNKHKYIENEHCKIVMFIALHGSTEYFFEKVIFIYIFMLKLMFKSMIATLVRSLYSTTNLLFRALSSYFC